MAPEHRLLLANGIEVWARLRARLPVVRIARDDLPDAGLWGFDPDASVRRFRRRCWMKPHDLKS